MLLDNKLLPYDSGKRIVLDMKEKRWVWTGGKVVGRVDGNRLVPYYTRRDIDVDRVLEKNGTAKVIAWLASPAELMNIHVQGSATLQFPDGRKQQIFAMYTNSLPFRNYMEAISKIKKLPLDKKVINDYLDQHPDEALALLSENPRYVFFKLREKANRETTINDIENLVPYRSIAVDTRYIPLGAVALLRGKVTKGSYSDGNVTEKVFFVTAQDIGGAVKGAHIDFFTGSHLDISINDKAGQFYLILLKK
jgi:membrane-bound lytic murein transglycosylase A